MTTLEWIDEGINEAGVQERQFVIKEGRSPIPGIMWTPQLVENPLPLVLFGHGGSGHALGSRLGQHQSGPLMLLLVLRRGRGSSKGRVFMGSLARFQSAPSLSFSH